MGKITDEVLNDMPKLKTLQCRGCPALKDKGISALIEMAQNLELLDLSGCNNITNELLEVAVESTKHRTNNVVLKVYVGGTAAEVSSTPAEDSNEDPNKFALRFISPYLQVLNVDLSDAHMRPDFDHNEFNFFPTEDYEFGEFGDMDDDDYLPIDEDDFIDYDGASGEEDELYINDDMFHKHYEF